MISKSDNEIRAEYLAREVMTLARNTLLVRLRFLDAAVGRMELVSGCGVSMATDGKNVFYDAVPLLKKYKAENNVPTRDYLHTVLHCVFHHNFSQVPLDPVYWDLACDVAVENVIDKLEISSFRATRAWEQTDVIEFLTKKATTLTAENLYRYFREIGLDRTKAEIMRKPFLADDHEIWYKPPEQEPEDGEGNANGNSDPNARNLWGDEALEKDWQKISERMKEELESFEKKHGTTSGSLMQNLDEVTRERYDYTSFLKKFAVHHEMMKINDDEFDYNFYTYGLHLYKDMPLVEPLEYKEVKRVKEIVIAIDTSGSVQGKEVQSFLQKTYNILKSQESFFTKFHLRILQCDTQIKEDKKITSQEEFDEYIRTMKLHGFGGTDFRPVFSYVEELIRRKEFVALKGLLYFTDGYGVFPSEKPSFRTAFIFVNDKPSRVPKVPVWAIKLVLPVDYLRG